MNTLQIQDAFEPYYAGREEHREGADQAIKKPDLGLSQQKRATRRIKDRLQATRQEHRPEDRD